MQLNQASVSDSEVAGFPLSGVVGIQRQEQLFSINLPKVGEISNHSGFFHHYRAPIAYVKRNRI